MHRQPTGKVPKADRFLKTCSNLKKSTEMLWPYSTAVFTTDWQTLGPWRRTSAAVENEEKNIEPGAQLQEFCNHCFGTQIELVGEIKVSTLCAVGPERWLSGKSACCTSLRT